MALAAGELQGKVFVGAVKSYNSRRGFGFLACAEAARLYGRDVYLSKAEVTAAVGEGGDALTEGESMRFSLQLSPEGFPQAVNAERLTWLHGEVVRTNIDCQGCSAVLCMANSAEAALVGGPEVAVRQAACGRLILAAGDWVQFRAAEGLKAPEAQVVELLETQRSKNDVLGCFSLELPRLPLVETSGGEAVIIDGHALHDRMVLANIPSDLPPSDLARFFTKLGATEVAMEQTLGNGTRAAVVSFPGLKEVGQVLTRTVHTLTGDRGGSTFLAQLHPPRSNSSQSLLPAVATSAPEPARDGTLFVRWSSAAVATAYSIEVQPAGSEAWTPVHVTAGRLGQARAVAEGVVATGGSKQESSCCSCGAGQRWLTASGLSDFLEASKHASATCLIDPSCTSCAISGLAAGTLHEVSVRISYGASCGCRSEPSELVPSRVAEARPAVVSELPPVADATPVLATVPMAVAAQPTQTATSPPIYRWCLPEQPDMASLPVAEVLGAGWWCPHGGLVPSPMAPEMEPTEAPQDESGMSICIRWPSVVHAASYDVEIHELGLTINSCTVAGDASAMLIELCVNGLTPGRAYAANVCCVAPCGCKSAPTDWAYLIPAPLMQAGASATQAPAPTAAQAPTGAPEPSSGPCGLTERLGLLGQGGAMFGA